MSVTLYRCCSCGFTRLIILRHTHRTAPVWFTNTRECFAYRSSGKCFLTYLNVAHDIWKRPVSKWRVRVGSSDAVLQWCVVTAGTQPCPLLQRWRQRGGRGQRWCRRKLSWHMGFVFVFIIVIIIYFCNPHFGANNWREAWLLVRKIREYITSNIANKLVLVHLKKNKDYCGISVIWWCKRILKAFYYSNFGNYSPQLKKKTQ